MSGKGHCLLLLRDRYIMDLYRRIEVVMCHLVTKQPAPGRPRAIVGDLQATLLMRGLRKGDTGASTGSSSSGNNAVDVSNRLRWHCYFQGNMNALLQDIFVQTSSTSWPCF